MTTRVPTDAPDLGALPVVRRDPRLWVAPTALGAAGALHVVLAVVFTGHGLVQTSALLIGLGQIATACYAGGLLLAGLRWDLPTLGLVVAGTTALVALDFLAHTTTLLTPPALHAAHPSGAGHLLVGAATVGAEVVAVLSLAGALPPSWPGRARDLLLGLGVLAWLLWLAGALG